MKPPVSRKDILFMSKYRIHELTAPQALQRMELFPAAWIPLGTVEWHSSHLPLGTDGLKAERLCEMLAERFGGLSFPVFYIATCMLQFPLSFSTTSKNLKNFLNDFLLELERLGFKYIFIISGHYSGEQLITLSEAAETYMKIGESLVMATREAGPINDSSKYFDHAALFETSIMLALFPSLVVQASLDKSAPKSAFSMPDSWKNFGVMGSDPREATAELGQKIIDEIMGAWEVTVTQMRSDNAKEFLADFYSKQRNFLRDVLPHYANYFDTGDIGADDWEEIWDNSYLQYLDPEEVQTRSHLFKSVWRKKKGIES